MTITGTFHCAARYADDPERDAIDELTLARTTSITAPRHGISPGPVFPTRLADARGYMQAFLRLIPIAWIPST